MARFGAEAFLTRFSAAAELLPTAPGFEAAIRILNQLSQQWLGDAEAARLPQALKPGERDYRVAGAFMITPDRRYNMLVGNVGFPAEQRRLMIPIEWNDPGWVVANARPLLIPDTDKHTNFRQFLKTSRMGSSIYAPILGPKGMVGQMVAAAQARGTYDASDLDRLKLVAALAGWAHALHSGDTWLRADYPAPDAWRADEQASPNPDEQPK